MSIEIEQLESHYKYLLQLLSEEHNSWRDADMRAIKAEARVRELERKIKEFVESCR